MKIVCDDRIPFLRGVLEPYADVIYKSGAETTPEDVKDADILITRTRTMCGPSLLDGSGVRMIATATIGFDHIDTEWCASHGIEWVNAPGCNSGSVCQYVASALCCMSARYSLDLRKLTLGVVGVGNVGSKVVRLGRLLGMKVLSCDPPREALEGGEGYVGLEEICSCCDIVTLHVPLTAEGAYPTVHLFDGKRLASMKDGAILINSSRGPVVDGKALLGELRRGRLRAVLDVWENEPFPDRELMSLCDIVTPHIAGYSAAGKALGTAMAVRAVSRRYGLPLDDWYPVSIPGPEGGLDLTIDAGSMSCHEVLMRALESTYDVLSDDARLRYEPSGFEYQRGHYPVRREPSAYTVQLLDADAERAEVLEKAGFGKVVIRVR